MRKLALFIGVCLVIWSSAQGREKTNADSTRLTNIDKDWRYLEQPETDVKKLNSYSGWQKIDLPHTWNNMDATDLVPGYRRNGSWYKKDLKISDFQKDKRYFLYFEGANISTKVYVNGSFAGQHIGGYLGFEIELTKFLKQSKNETNEILVRVDNSYDPEIIPSQKSDFFIYGGITRDVWLKTVPEAYIKRVIVNTPSVSKTNAETEIKILFDAKQNPERASLACNIFDPLGKTVFDTTFSLPEKMPDSVSFMLENLKNPKLWDVDDPNLYTVQVILKEKGTPSDEVKEKYGYRWFEFKDHGPFFLNGRRLLIRGTHRHEEHAGYGAAMPNSLHRQDIEAIKDMGGNFVRLGHYPQDPEVYKACDELGILVWDELPWCRGGVGDEEWKENTRRFLREMITQNRNHPSVILWSLGNEIYWLPDFEGGGDTNKINAFLKELNSLAHHLDPGRKTALRKYYEGAGIVDVFSPSIWAGWYMGNYKVYEKAIKESMKAYPHFLHAEYGGSSQVGRHNENPITGEGTINPEGWEEPVNQVEVNNIAQHGDWSENYIVDLFDWHLKVSETTPDFTGNIQWALKDFGTPLRPENDIPYVNQKGLMDRAGHPKDAYYVFKSYWSKDPFCYIESHTWTERSGPKDLPRNICVYSSCEEVELFKDGKSLGRKKKDINKFPASGLNWDLLFEEGENELTATGYNNGKEVATDSLQISYSFEKNGSPGALILSSQKMDNGHLLVEALAVDDKGNRCLDYEERVYFQCLSGGTTMKNMGTPTGSESIKMANGRAAIEVVPKPGADELVMTVLNQDFKGSFLVIQKDLLP